MKNNKYGIMPGLVTPKDPDRIATLTAKLELIGISVYALSCGGFLVSSCQWCVGRYCSDIEQLGVMAERLGATKDNAMRQGMAYQGTQQDRHVDFIDCHHCAQEQIGGDL